MPEGAVDQESADQQSADKGAADQGGNQSAAGGNTGGDAPSNLGDLLMYATLPLCIGLSKLGSLAVSRIDWKQYATSPLLVLGLMDANGVPRNLTGALSVTLRLLPALGSSVVIAEAMTVLYAAGGQVGYKLQASDVDAAGTFYLEVEVVNADGSAEYYPSDGTIVFVINPSLGGP